MATRIAALLLFIAATSPLCPAQDPATQPATSPSAEDGPLHRLRFPGNPSIYSAAFSPDGTSLYVHISGQAVNVWEVLVYYWPEILGGVTALTVLICTSALWRIAHRKRIVGEPHCRRCGYCLKGCPSDRCPECGTPIKRPVLGRPLWRRTLPWAAVLAVVVLAYGGLWAFRTPRTGSASRWVNWWSYDLDAWARAHGVWLTSWVRNVDRVLEVDTLSGQTRRTLLTREHLRNSWCPLVVTPDGRDLVLTIGDGDRLALASTSSGAVRRTLSHHLALHAFVSRWHQIAGFDRDGRNVYVVALDEPAKKTQLVRWELGSGGSAVLFTCDADLVAQQGRPPDVWPRRFYCVPGVQPPRLLELPSPMVNETQKVPAEVHIRDGTDPNRILASFSTTLWGRSDLAFSPEGDRAYILSPSSMRAPLAFDLSTGQVCGHLRVPNHNVGSIDGQAQDRLVASGWRQPGLLGLLTGTGDQDVFLVCDLRNPRSVSDFPQPAEGIYRELYMSPDGRFFAASGFLKEKNPSGRYQLELLIYDVRSMPRAVQGDRD